MANLTRLAAGGIVAVHHKGEGLGVNADGNGRAIRSQACCRASRGRVREQVWQTAVDARALAPD
jgi:hypothetical protein